VINWHSFFFLASALVACTFAVAVVVSSNIVRMAFYLIISLGAVSGLFFLAGADFVGALQLMIYVGGTLVLLVFGVMLTAQGPFISMRLPRGQWILGGATGAALLAVLLSGILGATPWTQAPPAADQLNARPATSAPLGLGLLGVRVDRLEQSNPRLAAGMSGYLLAFEIVSVHLLVVLVGAAYLARARKWKSDELDQESE
jgi:NADH:ubiquinone oxidoreductase subunit 6 (subunit J)